MIFWQYHYSFWKHSSRSSPWKRGLKNFNCQKLLGVHFLRKILNGPWILLLKWLYMAKSLIQPSQQCSKQIQSFCTTYIHGQKQSMALLQTFSSHFEYTLLSWPRGYGHVLYPYTNPSAHSRNCSQFPQSLWYTLCFLKLHTFNPCSRFCNSQRSIVILGRWLLAFLTQSQVHEKIFKNIAQPQTRLCWASIRSR